MCGRREQNTEIERKDLLLKLGIDLAHAIEELGGVDLGEDVAGRKVMGGIGPLSRRGYRTVDLGDVGTRTQELLEKHLARKGRRAEHDQRFSLVKLLDARRRRRHALSLSFSIYAGKEI